MELRYAFDPERYCLGGLCHQGHRWPGTDHSLRRIVQPAGGAKRKPHWTGVCMGCTGRKLSDWLISFIDYEASGFPPGYKLGRLCDKGHEWQGKAISLRNKQGKCIKCEEERRATDEYKAMQARRGREWRSRQDPEQLGERGRQRWLNLPPEQRQQRVDYKRRLRAEHLAQGLTTRGTTPISPDAEARALRDAIRRAGHLPSVARLVWMAQRDHWREHPEDHAEHKRQCRRRYHQWQQLTDPDYRLYHRQKSKRRKALERGSIGVHVRPRQIRARFAEFDHRCAYCGARGDLHIEHLVPIARGGPHVLGNILPACQRCNFSKRDKDAETWYRSQPWFSEVRWRKIRRVMGIGSGHAAQLALL